MKNPDAILKLLSSSRDGMTARQVCEALKYDDLAVVHVTLSMMRKSGLVMRDLSVVCPHCHHPAACYRITENGRIRLTHRGIIA